MFIVNVSLQVNFLPESLLTFFTFEFLGTRMNESVSLQVAACLGFVAAVRTGIPPHL